MIGSASASVEALAASLIGAVRRGINLQIVLLLGGVAGGPHTDNPNAVSEWMRAGLWHVVAATGWVPAEPAALQKEATAKVRAYGGELRRLVPASGAYLNENDWDEPDWQRSFWGADGSYERLLRVKDAENCEVLWAELRGGSWSVLRRLRPTLDG